MHVRPFDPRDWDTVRDIYRQGIETKNATFQSNVKTWPEWDASVLPQCRLVAVLDVAVVGWVALSAVSSRKVYRGVAEVSIYIASRCWGQGVGKVLLGSLVEASEKEGFWTLQAGIFPENVASIALHERCGFRVVGTREKLGSLDGHWRDVVLMERRSKTVGV